MKTKIFKIVATISIIYAIICGLLYLFQENMIFFPKKLKSEYVFSFDEVFEEIYFKVSDGTTLHGLLFKSENPEGLVFYLHGNAGALDSWGAVAKTYVNLNCDVLILDYRGFGKSEGKIQSQDQLFDDIQTVYTKITESYQEEDIIVLGYSIGTGPATKLAADNNPRLLILQAPYYSLTDLVSRKLPFIPSFLLEYKLETYKYISNCNMPVIIFHGDQDEVIYHGSSLKLMELTKDGDTLINLTGQTHNDITNNPVYRSEIKRIFDESD